MRTELRHGLTAALKARDRVAASALRSALAAIDNAEAVDAAQAAGVAGAGDGHVAGAAVGLGAAERPRRELDEHQVRAIVEREIAERVDAAEAYERAGHPEAARDLTAEVEVLRRHLPGPG